jgi:hypothetical protein
LLLYLPFGLIFAAVSAIQAFLSFLSLIGIPVALVIAKSLGTVLNPVNKVCVHAAVAEELERRDRSLPGQIASSEMQSSQMPTSRGPLATGVQRLLL